MVTNQSKQYDDDGRTICDMNVAGMRWYDKAKPKEVPEFHRAAVPGQQMSRAESLKYTWYAVLAGLTVVGAISAVWILFTLFCTQIWFR
jgi:hypothetical protein